jgi:hypothetical protein
MERKGQKVFCLCVDIQDQKYRLHHQNNLMHINQKKMRNMGMTLFSGSKYRITSSAEWKSKHSVWDGEATSSVLQWPDERDSKLGFVVNIDGLQSTSS